MGYRQARVPEGVWRDKFQQDQIEINRNFERQKHSNSDCETYFDNSDYPQANRFRGKYLVRMHAVRLARRYGLIFVSYDVTQVERIPTLRGGMSSLSKQKKTTKKKTTKKKTTKKKATKLRK